MNRMIIVLTADLGLFQAIELELGKAYTCSMCHSLSELASHPERENATAVLIHYHSDVLRGTSGDRFRLEVERTVENATTVALLGIEVSPRNRAICEDQFDRCVPLPLAPGELLRCLNSEKDIEQELEAFWADAPHRELHGRSRSLVTFSPQMFEMLDEIQVAAKHNVTCLLIGETGSGKTFLARLLHELSDQRDERMCTVACGALPPDLIESELFGYVKGAFTGADRDREGKFAAAGAGTLLLDEIDVLPPEQQAKLLRVIETGEYEPVGSNETRRSEARLIVASNYNLDELVQRGTFRTDLYYRLNILSFQLLPLRQRPADIEFLARRFAIEHGRSHGIRIRRMESEFLDALKKYPWPGNVREMENVIRRAVLYCKRGILSTKDLPSSIRGVSMDQAAAAPIPAAQAHASQIQPGMPVLSDNAAFERHNSQAYPAIPRDPSPQMFQDRGAIQRDYRTATADRMEMFREGVTQDRFTTVPIHDESGQPRSLEARVDLLECQIITDSLRRNNHRRKETALELGISRVTLYNKMKKFGLL